ncbi:MAG: hypothetical protein IKX32_02105 [Bacteroidales bacterium]|nr:hypothetical protein [Bacteroidales bacterium]
MNEIKEYWLTEYWPDLQKADFDSEEKIDTKLFAVSSGAIALIIGTLSFTEKHQQVFLAMLAVMLFVTSIILNIFYHFIATKNHQKQFKQISQLVSSTDEDDTSIRETVKNGNCTLLVISIISVVLILGGFILAGIYLYANIK